MLTEQGCLARRQRLWEAVPENVDWVLVADPRHVQYLANFWVQPLSFSGGERGLLVLTRDGEATLLGDNFALRSAAHKPYVSREILETWYDHKHSVINRDHALLAALKQMAPELAGRHGLVEAEWLPIGASEVLPLASVNFSASQETDAEDLSDLGTILRHLRRQKEPDEIALIQECIQAGEAGHAWLREHIRPGMTELEIYLEVQRAALAAAGRPGLVYGDFRAANAEHPKVGGLPTDYALKEGDVFTLDYSVVLDGYRGDFTNALAVGTPSEGVKELFALCEAAMQGGESTLKAGTPSRDVWAATMQPFADAGRKDVFPHHAGHGIGLAHPEPPIHVPDSHDVLLAGDVVTLEPGAYVEGIGGMRIEHNYLITEEGYERLTNHVIALN
ncbi:MAG: aminopeptidase P family protein [Planctomycetaceae bacterium]|nr:aminopeptidase P family protein [Planctomycetaceae bacterium]